MQQLQLQDILTLRLLLYRTSRRNRGFTLIELLVVVIIVGVLSAVAFPNILGQLSKAREAEAIKNLSSIGSAQQAFHFEKGSFAPDLGALDVNFSPDFYNYTLNDSSATRVRINATVLPTTPQATSVRDYSLGVYFDTSGGGFQVVICRAAGGTVTVSAPDAAADTCTNSGEKLL